MPPIAQVTMVKLKKSPPGLSAPFINLPAQSNEIIGTVSGKWLVDVLSSVISIHSEACGNLAGDVDETGDQAEYSPICIGVVPDSQMGNKTSHVTKKRTPERISNGLHISAVVQRTGLYPQ